jgi:hypothetical protein
MERSLAILIGEDNPDEALLLRTALRELGFNDAVHVLPNGSRW